MAGAQTVPIRGDVDANLSHHAELVRAAADLHVQILVFPELSLTGYEPALARELAFAEDDPRLAPVIALACEHRMTLVVGAPVRLGTRLHIGAFVIYPNGEVDLYTTRLRSYAVQHRMTVVLSNFGGPTGGLPSAGGSAIWSPQGDLLAQLPRDGAGIAVATEKDIGWRGAAVPLAPDR